MDFAGLVDGNQSGGDVLAMEVEAILGLATFTGRRFYIGAHGADIASYLLQSSFGLIKLDIYAGELASYLPLLGGDAAQPLLETVPLLVDAVELLG